MRDKSGSAVEHTAWRNLAMADAGTLESWNLSLTSDSRQMRGQALAAARMCVRNGWRASQEPKRGKSP